MNRIQLAHRVATITVGTALSVAAVGGSAWAAPGQSGETAGPAHQTYTSPQPASTADFTGQGANVSGPYDSTRDGSASANGDAGDRAVGRPCAGCVGKADNKNPKGQMPGGSDHNAGYECDLNKGIGQGNPAHTGCTTTAAVATPAAVPAATAATVVVVAARTATPPALLAVKAAAPKLATAQVAPKVAAHRGAVVSAATAATPARPAEVLGVSVTRATPSSRSVAAATTLPFTGAPVRGLLLLALVLLTAGVALTAGLPRLGAGARRSIAVATA